MKYIISEEQYERLKRMVINYLDSLEWEKPWHSSTLDKITKLYIKGRSPHQHLIESYSDWDDDDNEFRVLLIDEGLWSTIRSLFKLPWEDMYSIMKTWYRSKTGEKIEEINTFQQIF